MCRISTAIYIKAQLSSDHANALRKMLTRYKTIKKLVQFGENQGLRDTRN